MRLRLAAVVAFAGLSAAVGLTQPPKPKDPPKDPKDMPAKTAEPPARKVNPPGAGAGVDQVFTSADGVKISGRFYRSSKATGSVVIMIGATGQKGDDVAWVSTAGVLNAAGFHVLQFDPRGTGGSTDITPSVFFANPFNKMNVNPGSSVANKTTLTSKDLRGGYHPMMVQDLAAARNALDQMNDNGDVNTSTVYLLGTGDAAGLGLFFLATEWLRERQKPNLAFPAMFVSPRRGLLIGSEPAGRDYGGAVWISPARNNALDSQALKAAVLSPAAIDMKTETPMLFVYGSKDSKGKAAATTFASDILAAKTPKPGAKTSAAQTVFTLAIDKAGVETAVGLKLLGSNSGAEERIVEFLSTKESERKSRTRKSREWDKPLIIDVAAFGFGPR